MSRLFQNFGVYPAYLDRLYKMVGTNDHRAVHNAFHDDRFIAIHMLKPTLERSPEATFALGRDERSQRDWAKAHGMSAKVTMDNILRAQIEEHRAEIFYNHDGIRYGSEFVARLPGCVRKSIVWQAAPAPVMDFDAYDRVVCNFPSMLRTYEQNGWTTGWFAPAHDPAMDEYSANQDRPIDILFVGTYSRHHKRRSRLVEQLAALANEHEVRLHLLLSRMTRLAETPVGWIGPLRNHRRTAAVRAISRPPVFGRELYRALAGAKVVVNVSIDMAGIDRGNMRCWETLGNGALMLSDAGNYPEGMDGGRTIETYDSLNDLVAKAKGLLADEPRRRSIAAAGNELVRSRYTKERQWAEFLNLL